jgi:hypothetical protein
MAALPAPAVTAITIFLNEEKFLAEAVESVLAQSSQDWELLLSMMDRATAAQRSLDPMPSGIPTASAG